MNKTGLIALSVLAIGGLVATVLIARKPPVLATTTTTKTSSTEHNGILGFVKGLHLSIA